MTSSFFLPKEPSEVSLLLSNMIPVIGVLFWGWSSFGIMTTVWLENVVVAVVTVLKMLAWSLKNRGPQGVFFAPIFCFHYGMFTALHGIFVMIIFSHRTADTKGLIPPDIQTQILSIHGLMAAVAGLVVHHLFSFYINFIRAREIDRSTPIQLMLQPYGRLALLHMSLILGGMPVVFLGNPVWAVLMLGLLKTLGDLVMHRRAHDSTGKLMSRASKDSRTEEN